MRVLVNRDLSEVKGEAFDVCDVDGFKEYVKHNPKGIILVRDEYCGEDCDRATGMLDNIAERKQLPFLVIDFGEYPIDCPALAGGNAIVVHSGENKRLLDVTAKKEEVLSVLEEK